MECPFIKLRLATPNEDDTELASPDEFYGFPVDAGLAGFMDMSVLAYYNQFLDNFYTAHHHGNINDDFFKNIIKLTATEDCPDAPSYPRRCSFLYNYCIETGHHDLS